MAAPFIVPSTSTICSAVFTWRISSAASDASSVRTTFAVLVPACFTADDAAARPTLASRR